MHQRKFLLVGNWKLNYNKQATASYFEEFISNLGQKKSVDIALAPVCLYLDFCQSLVKNTQIKLSGQNCFYQDSGAYTGEYSAHNLAELGIKLCIVGHSERRSFFGETNIIIAKKTRACFKAGVTPIICVGESLEEREAGKTQNIINKQVTSILEFCSEYKKNNFIIAYEPIWAIGTGKTADPRQIQEIHAQIREIISNNWGSKISQDTQILYGGSVKPENIEQICACPDVDGALVGGASLRVASFLSMVTELENLACAQSGSIG